MVIPPGITSFWMSDPPEEWLFWRELLTQGALIQTDKIKMREKSSEM
jgi:hypothetical protein